MENIFNSPENASENSSIIEQYNVLKDNYADIFMAAANSIRASIEKFKPEKPCDTCKIKCGIDKVDIFSDFPVGCPYKDWQAQTLSFLNGEYKQKLKNTLQTLLDKREDYSCSECGDCCKLAVSEYSYEQLKQRAYKGDKYSQDFISVFVPYKTEEEAKLANPEFFEAVDVISTEKAYFYYCPKVKNNLCSDYENRPDVCKNYPNNPLKLLHAHCSYNEWRKEVVKTAMMLRAKDDIIAFYKEKLG